MKPFYVVVPNQIRAFVRTTNGVARGEEPNKVVTAYDASIANKAKQRKNFDAPPRYSTVNLEFQKGEEGLVDMNKKLTAKDMAVIAQKTVSGMEDWGLTYGKKGAKINP